MLLLSQESCFWMEACVCQGVGHGVDVSDHLLGGSDLCCWQPFGVYGEGLSLPVHTRAVLMRLRRDNNVRKRSCFGVVIWEWS